MDQITIGKSAIKAFGEAGCGNKFYPENISLRQAEKVSMAYFLGYIRAVRAEHVKNNEVSHNVILVHFLLTSAKLMTTIGDSCVLGCFP